MGATCRRATQFALVLPGFAIGCRALRAIAPKQTLQIRLNDDAVFSFPFTDGYWSLLLDRHYSYERDIDVFFRSVTDADFA